MNVEKRKRILRGVNINPTEVVSALGGNQDGMTLVSKIVGQTDLDHGGAVEWLLEQGLPENGTSVVKNNWITENLADLKKKVEVIGVKF